MQTHPGTTGVTDAFAALERSVRAALETYANVHRGSGHHSVATTRLFEQARDIVLAHMGLDDGRHVVAFGSPRSIATLTAQLARTLPCGVSGDIGLPLGVRRSPSNDTHCRQAHCVDRRRRHRAAGRPRLVMWAPARAIRGGHTGHHHVIACTRAATGAAVRRRCVHRHAIRHPDAGADPAPRCARGLPGATCCTRSDSSR
jgi:hypothetical protein